jgi:hypothetical protein
MRIFLNAIKNIPHPEEARSAVSKDAIELHPSVFLILAQPLRYVGPSPPDLLGGQSGPVCIADNFATLAWYP